MLPDVQVPPESSPGEATKAAAGTIPAASNAPVSAAGGAGGAVPAAGGAALLAKLR